MNVENIQNQTLLVTSTCISKIQAAYSEYRETELFYKIAQSEAFTMFKTSANNVTEEVLPYKKQIVAEANQTRQILNARRNVISPQELAYQAKLAKQKLADSDSLSQTVKTISNISYYSVVNTILKLDKEANILGESLYNQIKKELSALESWYKDLQPEYRKQHEELCQKINQRLSLISERKQEIVKENYWENHKEEKEEYDALIKENKTISESIDETNKELEILRKERDVKQPKENEKNKYIEQLDSLELQLNRTTLFQHKKKKQLAAEINLIKHKIESISPIAASESSQHIERYNILIKEAKDKIISLTKRKDEIQLRFNEINNNIKKYQ